MYTEVWTGDCHYYNIIKSGAKLFYILLHNTGLPLLSFSVVTMARALPSEKHLQTLLFTRKHLVFEYKSFREKIASYEEQVLLNKQKEAKDKLTFNMEWAIEDS